jgi:hypothetical protein
MPPASFLISNKLDRLWVAACIFLRIFEISAFKVSSSLLSVRIFSWIISNCFPISVCPAQKRARDNAQAGLDL